MKFKNESWDALETGNNVTFLLSNRRIGKYYTIVILYL